MFLDCILKKKMPKSEDPLPGLPEAAFLLCAHVAGSD